MYRVELKAVDSWPTAEVNSPSVPNVPCGVERRDYVPNPGLLGTFLMYRVELKAVVVPVSFAAVPWFLMCRVELKVNRLIEIAGVQAPFLMYRVELKETSINRSTSYRRSS